MKKIIATETPKETEKNEITDLRQYIVQQGQNPLSYLTLEKDKSLYIGKEYRGVCGYKIDDHSFVVLGDVIADEETVENFLGELRRHVHHLKKHLVFLNTTDRFLKYYKSEHFTIVKFGEDAVFNLSEYNLAGKRAAKVRAAINHGNKAGILVQEYKPHLERNTILEKEMEELTKNWMDTKGGVMMEFSVGSLSLEDPGDRRYFYATLEEKLIGLTVFIPYENKKGYLADITRRGEGAPQGCMEKLIYDAFMCFKEEGTLWGNLGLSPLFHVVESKGNLVEQGLNQIYEHMNGFYDFKALHHSKLKFGPTQWEPRYIVYQKTLHPLRMAKSIIGVQFPKNARSVVLESIKGRE